jgi:hypothetical protein
MIEWDGAGHRVLNTDITKAQMLTVDSFLILTL